MIVVLDLLSLSLLFQPTDQATAPLSHFSILVNWLGEGYAF